MLTGSVSAFIYCRLLSVVTLHILCEGGRGVGSNQVMNLDLHSHLRMERKAELGSSMKSECIQKMTRVGVCVTMLYYSEQIGKSCDKLRLRGTVHDVARPAQVRPTTVRNTSPAARVPAVRKKY
jgi:hypothetical protein